MGHLTKADFERVIDEGGSILHMGRHIFKKDDIPPDSELAAQHAQRARSVVDSVDIQIAQLTALRASLATSADGASTADVTPDNAPPDDPKSKKAKGTDSDPASGTPDNAPPQG